MRSPKLVCVFPLIAALLLSSCETAEQNHTPAVPPVGATAPTLTHTSQQAPAPPRIHEERPVAPQPADPAAALIERVEKEYKAGQANYSAGHLEAAKANFDNAFNMLLQGPPAIKSDDRLENEFEKIVDGINSLELLALKEGDGFTEQRSEPAPIDEANAVTFPVDPSVKAKATEELKLTQSDMPLMINDAVASYINYFSSSGRGFLEHGYVRSGRYREMVARIFKEEGLPQDLIYLAQAESGFHPLAVSRARARGMWQFMAGTAVLYGMKSNWWVDDRQDPETATHAAAKHLKDLYNQFGDWYLAMAAYNSGAGTVQRAVQRTGYADYWELYRRGVLPQETRNYVPIILAITIMSKNPAQYGLDRLQPDRPISPDRVRIDYPVDLRLVAECVDTSVATLQELNPSLLRLTTPKDQAFELRLPQGTRDQFEKAIAAIPADMRVWWHYHRVAPGDTLASLAKRYRTTGDAIAKVNDLDREAPLPQHAKLVIPVTPGRNTDGEVRYAKAATHYKVRKGDTVLSIADKFDVPADNVRKWNKLRGNVLTPGHTLVIHRAVRANESESRTASASKRGAKSKTTARSHSRRGQAEEAAAERPAKRGSKNGSKTSTAARTTTARKSAAQKTASAKTHASAGNHTSRATTAAAKTGNHKKDAESSKVHKTRAKNAG